MNPMVMLRHKTWSNYIRNDMFINKSIIELLRFKAWMLGSRSDK